MRFSDLITAKFIKALQYFLNPQYQILSFTLKTMKVKVQRRYHFWRVFWVVIAVYIFLMIIGLAFASIAPTSENSYNYDKLLTWKHAAKQLVGMLVSVVFFYFSLNAYYRVIAEKNLLLII